MAAAGTDTAFQAEVYSYSRSRGLFAGVSFDGSMLQIDGQSGATYYQQGAAIPPSATQLVSRLNAYSGGQAAAPAGQPARQTSPEEVRRELTSASARLTQLLTPQWQQYLALPPSVQVPEGNANNEALAARRISIHSPEAA